MIIIDKPKIYQIHKNAYTEVEDDQYDILQTYNKKYQITINLRFPKIKENELVDKL